MYHIKLQKAKFTENDLLVTADENADGNAGYTALVAAEEAETLAVALYKMMPGTFVEELIARLTKKMNQELED